MKAKNYQFKYLKIDEPVEYAKLLKEKKKERTEREKEDYFERIVDINLSMNDPLIPILLKQNSLSASVTIILIFWWVKKYY